MAGRNPRGAVLDQKYYESKDIISYFENLCEPLLIELRLQKNGSDLQFDARDLSIFIGQLLQFQQDNLGIFSKPTSNTPLRIPARLFKTNNSSIVNNTSGGSNKKNKRKPSYTTPLSFKQHPLYIILLAAYIFRIKHNWKKWELNNPSKKLKNLELIQFIRTYLIKQKFIIPPKILLDKSVPNNAKKTIQLFIKKVNGQLTDKINNATHVLHGSLHDYNEIDEDWFRTLEKKDGKVLVHWWYYPDSYDSWLIQTDQFEDPEDAPSHHGPWHLNCRWLQDSVKFNELMNEEDYEDIESDIKGECDQQEEGEMEEEIEGEIENEDNVNDEDKEGEGDDDEENDEEVEEEEEEDEEQQLDGDGDDDDDDDEEEEEEGEEEDDDDDGEEDDDEEDDEDDEDVNMMTNRNNTNRQLLIDDEKSISNTPTASITSTRKKSPKRKMSEAFADNSSVMDEDDDNLSQSTYMNIQILDINAQPSVKIREVDIERPTISSRQRKNEYEPYINGDITNVSQYTIKYIDIPPSTLKIEDDNHTKTEVDNMEENEFSTLYNAKPQDYKDVCKPDWLDLEKVNNIEKLAFPGYFDDHQNDYITYRNFMVETYYSNPAYYLTISTCKLAFPDADLLYLARIHSFLELNNVINCQTDPRRRIYNPIIDSEPEAHMEINPQRSLEIVDNVDLPKLRKLMYDSSRLDKVKSTWDLKIEDPMNADQQKIFKCYHCHQHCNSIRYQSLKRYDLHLCIDCFVNGRFPSVYYSNDFLRLDEEINGNNNLNSNFLNSINMNLGGINNEPEIDEEWTDEEILRLLEGVDQYDDDWLMVSEHVRSRTKEQCIIQFLQMPINDDFYNVKLSEVELDEIPFANTSNPIMTLVTYLAAHVNPGVAGIAAKIAMKELLNASKNTNSIERNHDDDNDKKKIKKEEEEEEDIKIEVEDDAMDIDHISDNSNDENKPIFSKETTSAATFAALKAAAIHAHKLSNYEDQEIQHWVRLAVKTMVDKLTLKLQQYEEFEQSLEIDHQEIEKSITNLQTSLDNLRQQHFPLPSATEYQQTINNTEATPSTSNNN